MEAEDAQRIDELAVAAQSGDRDAFRLLVLATERDLRITIAAHSGSRESADEALQHTYVAAFEKLAQYRPSRTFGAWLKAIARNYLVDRWRESRRFAALDGAVLDELVAVAAEDALESAETEREAEAQTRRLRACLERLPERSRKLLERRYQDGLSLDALAQRFHRTAKLLSVALFRVRQVLRRCLESSE